MVPRPVAISRHRAAGVLLVVLCVVTASLVAGPDAVEAAPSAQSCGPSPFTSGFAAYLQGRWPGQRFTAAVYDTRTGCEDRFRSDLRLTTASVIKIEIMAGILLRAQREGRSLTQWERDRILPMITQSANPPTSELWSSLGGVPAMHAFDLELGLNETVAAGPTWGLTTTSAADRNRLLRQLLRGEYGPFNAWARAEARNYMLAVVPSQRWGVTAGAPRGWRVPLKNGFFDSTCCNWRLNSSGVVERTDGTAYIVTVLSDGWPSEAPGIEGVELVSRVIAATVAAPFAPFTSPRTFAERLFGEVLGRPPSFEQTFFTTQTVGFDTWRAPDPMADLLRSAEFDRTGGLVLRLYVGALGRLPDPEVYARRAWQIRTGRLTASAMAGEIAAAAEFTGGTVLDDEAFVDRVFRQVLGRPSKPSERSDWAALLRGGATRGWVLLHFTESPTAHRLRGSRTVVAAAYLTLLERPPAPTVLTDWATKLSAGTPLRDLTAQIYRSAEYQQRVS